MGYEKIILLGVDTVWKTNDKIVDMKESYFFESYFNNKPYDIKKFCSSCTEESIQKMHFGAWENLKEMIEVNEIKLDIVNCSEGSALKSFRQSTLEKEL